MKYGPNYFHRLSNHIELFALTGALMLFSACSREKRDTPTPSITKKISDTKSERVEEIAQQLPSTDGAVRVAGEATVVPVPTPVPSAPVVAQVATPEIPADPVVMTCNLKLDPFHFYYLYRSPNNQFHLAQRSGGDQSVRPLGFEVKGQRITHFTRDAALSSDSREVATHQMEIEGKEIVVLLLADKSRRTLEVVQYASSDPSLKDRALGQSEIVNSSRLLLRSSTCREGLADRDDIIRIRKELVEAGESAREEANRVAAIAKDNWKKSGNKIENGAEKLVNSLAEVAERAKTQLQKVDEALRENAGDLGEDAKDAANDVARAADRGATRFHEALNAEISEIQQRFKENGVDWGAVAEPSDEVTSTLRDFLQRK